ADAAPLPAALRRDRARTKTRRRRVRTHLWPIPRLPARAHARWHAPPLPTTPTAGPIRWKAHRAWRAARRVAARPAPVGPGSANGSNALERDLAAQARGRPAPRTKALWDCRALRRAPRRTTCP